MGRNLEKEIEMFLEKMAGIFNALSDPTRLKLLKLLIMYQNDDVSVVALANELGVSQPAISQHLRILKAINLVEGKRDGMNVFYKINKKKLREYSKDIFRLTAFTAMGHFKHKRPKRIRRIFRCIL